MAERVKKTCSRGHTFYKTSDCPVCPTCWAGYYREKNQGDFPDEIPNPALRALLNGDIYNLSMLAEHTEDEVSKLHGMGPASMEPLKRALKSKGLAFKS